VLGHSVQFSVTFEPAAAVALMGAGFEPEMPPAV